jgi:polyribonucleotide nucleotidyltransferase
LKRSHRISDIPIRYLHFLTGAKNIHLQEIMDATETKIIIRKKSESDGIPASSFDVNITGEAEGVDKAVAAVQVSYSNLVSAITSMISCAHYLLKKSSTRTLTVNIPNRQHKHIVGVRGSLIAEIYEQTGSVRNEECNNR